MTTMRIAAVDVGIINCGYCVLSAAASEVPAPALSDLETRLADGRVLVEDWRVVQLGSSKSASTTSTFEKLLDFLREQQAQLLETDVLVVEQQMTARMKALSACFYGAVRILSPRTKVVFQSASAKLNFGDLAAFLEQPAVPLATYAQRKKAAVAAAKRLAMRCPSAPRAAFLAAKKKDDFSDALLHALAALCAHTAAAAAAAARAARGKARQRR